jgi:hypothetical protein
MWRPQRRPRTEARARDATTTWGRLDITGPITEGHRVVLSLSWICPIARRVQRLRIIVAGALRRGVCITVRRRRRPTGLSRAAPCNRWHFKLLKQRCQTRRNRIRNSIVIGLEASPDCKEPCPSVRQHSPPARASSSMNRDVRRFRFSHGENAIEYCARPVPAPAGPHVLPCCFCRTAAAASSRTRPARSAADASSARTSRKRSRPAPRSLMTSELCPAASSSCPSTA